MLALTFESFGFLLLLLLLLLLFCFFFCFVFFFFEVALLLANLNPDFPNKNSNYYPLLDQTHLRSQFQGSVKEDVC